MLICYNMQFRKANDLLDIHNIYVCYICVIHVYVIYVYVQYIIHEAHIKHTSMYSMLAMHILYRHAHMHIYITHPLLSHFLSSPNCGPCYLSSL